MEGRLWRYGDNRSSDGTVWVDVQRNIRSALHLRYLASAGRRRRTRAALAASPLCSNGARIIPEAIAHESMNAFDEFVVRHKAHLKRIAWKTRDEYQYDDVVQEAWIMASELSSRPGITADFDDPAFLKMLLSHLFQKLVRYAELNVRHATRLDHANSGDAEEGVAHPLMNKLAGDDGRHPLSYLLAIEDVPDPAAHSQHLHSLAGAYLALLYRLGNHMHAVAGHLLISLSHAYRCYARARWFAANQIPLTLPMTEADFALGPWRRARATRTPQQLAFDFEDQLPFGPSPVGRAAPERSAMHG